MREGLSICFFMMRPHSEVASGVMHSLETYLRALGPNSLNSYADEEGEWQRLDEASWEHTRQKLLNPRYANVHLVDSSSREVRYRFDYRGRAFDDPSIHRGPDETGFVLYWLPSELLEERGPQWVRELILELAAPLPFNSGNAGLAFNCRLDVVGVSREVRKHCFRYPGMDVLHPRSTAMNIGTRVRGPSWLTFLGQPVLGELGGVSGLRSRLHTPGTTVQELEGDRAVVTLGAWPEAGDTEQGKDLPAYRELARVLEPWTHRGDNILGDPEETRRWERRFLD
ncbi:DUF3396 domain-containing protein [Pyxidicoccus fallax]|uniref:DUF3396 domain-containing protein n=1 Tax=Pyxidicoccus fallax TaxID=394095 RepID=A0A848LDI9_9BACT|nr:DUF3396 domain-containing protein [Pyxidicoccus fallax]NPC79691.1 DUF3396 domain-containing protein [Pyxidicoccus fallax]